MGSTVSAERDVTLCVAALNVEKMGAVLWLGQVLESCGYNRAFALFRQSGAIRKPAYAPRDECVFIPGVFGPQGICGICEDCVDVDDGCASTQEGRKVVTRCRNLFVAGVEAVGFVRGGFNKMTGGTRDNHGVALNATLAFA